MCACGFEPSPVRTIPHLLDCRLEPLASSLALPIPALVRLIGKQPIIWLVKPAQVWKCVDNVCTQLWDAVWLVNNELGMDLGGWI